jgi:hypothetical protein
MKSGGETEGPFVSVIEAVVQKWSAASVAVNRGASKADLDRLADALGFPLPDGVRYFFSRANGMAGGEPERETMACFWPIEKILGDPWSPSGTDSQGPFQDLAFVDVLLDSWFVCFRTRPGQGITVHVEAALLELPSLEEFLRRYLAEPRSLCL